MSVKCEYECEWWCKGIVVHGRQYGLGVYLSALSRWHRVLDGHRSQFWAELGALPHDFWDSGRREPAFLRVSRPHAL